MKGPSKIVIMSRDKSLQPCVYLMALAMNKFIYGHSLTLNCMTFGLCDLKGHATSNGRPKDSTESTFQLNS